MTREQFAEFAPSLPHLPGVYKYFNADNTIIYIGKAKDLKKRVSNYFAKTIVHRKTRLLVQQITKIEFTIVPTEQDALLLESSLIKHFQPRYNIMLRDDKSYPHIVIKNEQYPRIFFTRRIIKDGSTYLGPYVNFIKVKELLEVIKQSLPIRTCNLPLTEDTIEKGKYKACLEYHIGNCKAPCINKQSRQDYNWYVQQIKEILRGKLGDIKKVYTEEMKVLAADMHFEKANLLKEKIKFLDDYTSKSVIVSTKIDNVDVVTIRSTPEQAVVNYMVVFNGTIVHSKTVIIPKHFEELDDEILSASIITLREQFSSTSKEIISDIEFDITGLDAFITMPKLGDKKKLLELSDQNVTYFMAEVRRQKTLMLTQSGDYAKVVLQEIKDNLRLTELPNHIECFDNSNFQGSFPVAAMVCFKDGQPYKKEYRHFHIKTVTGIDDFASMTEIVYRRYKRLTDEGKPLPQLVIIDGGKGQLGAALKALQQLDLVGKMAIVGLAKNVEEIFFPGDKQSLQLPYHSEGLKLITNIRDEVHRFGITFHRDTRSKGVIKNELESIKGIGENTATALLKKFKSVKKIKELTMREIAGVIGTAKARIIYEGLHPEILEEM
jgi:excinuclease ABC subunit C